MPDEERDPFHEKPEPSFVEVDEADLETAWAGEGDAKVVCPECDTGQFSKRGIAPDERRWVSFVPCGHVVVLADWAVA